MKPLEIESMASSLGVNLIEFSLESSCVIILSVLSFYLSFLPCSAFVHPCPHAHQESACADEPLGQLLAVNS